MRALLLASIVALSGCTTIGVEYTHLSHPFAGYPFGPAGEEDTLDGLQVTGRREHGRWYVEQSLGTKLRDGGVYGPDLYYQGRVGVYVIGPR